MNFAKVLTEQLGAEDRELEHLLACDECSVWNGYDGAELERCEDNPIVVEKRWIGDLHSIGRGLMAAFGLPRPPKGAMERLLDAMMEDYKAQIVAELNRPLFLDLVKK